jgi:hypothetical protein
VIKPSGRPAYVALANEVGGHAQVFFRQNADAFRAQGGRVEYLAGPETEAARKTSTLEHALGAALKAAAERQIRADSIQRLKGLGVDVSPEMSEAEITRAVQTRILEATKKR